MSPARFLLSSLICIAGVACDGEDPIGPDGVVEIRFMSELDTLLQGDTVHVNAVGVRSNGTVASNVALSWSSSNPAIVSVDSTGRLVARSPGRAIITASAAPIRNELVLEVIADPSSQSCAQVGSRHSGAILSTTWRAWRGPHWLDNDVTIDSLVIDPGSVICARPGVTLNARVLLANGTTQRPIRFLSGDGVSNWNGIRISEQGSGNALRVGSAQFSHVYVEFGNVANAGFFSGISIRDSRFRQSSMLGVDIHHSVVDTGDVAVSSGGIFEETTIRGGSLSLQHISHLLSPVITINGGRIEGSPGVALRSGSLNLLRSPTLNVVKTLRIIGSTGGVVDMPIANFLSLWPTREAQDSLLGNPNPQLNIWGQSFPALDTAVDAEHIHIRRELPWSVRGYAGFLTVGTATIEAGATVRLLGNLVVRGRMTAVGSEALPITFTSTTTATTCAGGGDIPCGLWLRGTGTSELSHVNFSVAHLSAGDQNRVQLDHIRAHHFISIRSLGSSIIDSEILNAPASLFSQGTLVLGADSIRVERVIVRNNAGIGILINGSFIQVLTCDITDNNSDGIEVMTGSNIEINECNIERNSGLGVDNRTANLVNAQRNWWGDPAGPRGPAGDGVSVNVDYSIFRTVRRTP